MAATPASMLSGQGDAGHLRLTAPPLSLYIHLPWCVRKCPYCDFNSHAAEPASVPEQAYIEALIRDIDLEAGHGNARPLQSLFIGGGTPSLFSPAAIARLLDAVGSRYRLASDVEITLEANPGTLDDARYEGYLRAGVNRLSIGVQSFDDDMLHRLGRIHDARAAEHAVVTARRAGFERINLDLMFGLPGQTLTGAMADLEVALSCDTGHLSWYQLTIEPNTLFYKHTPVLPVDDEIWNIQQAGRSLLHAAGYEQYEISAHARAGAECRHNLNYWRFGDYLGIGAGAHAKITDAATGRITRHVRHRMPDTYLKLAGTTAAITHTDILTRADLVIEFMMNAMRLTEGVPITLFEQHTGLPRSEIGAAVADAVARGLMVADRERLMPSEQGSLFLNDLLQCFMPA